MAGDGPDDEEHPTEQGLYVCLPAGQVTLEGFAQGGQADTMAPQSAAEVRPGALGGERPCRRDRMSAGGDWQADGAVQGEPVPVGRLAGEG